VANAFLDGHGHITANGLHPAVAKHLQDSHYCFHLGMRDEHAHELIRQDGIKLLDMHADVHEALFDDLPYYAPISSSE
jgi:hypothetical protein